jgi:hypothetical protein
VHRFIGEQGPIATGRSEVGVVLTSSIEAPGERKEAEEQGEGPPTSFNVSSRL